MAMAEPIEPEPIFIGSAEEIPAEIATPEVEAGEEAKAKAKDVKTAAVVKAKARLKSQQMQKKKKAEPMRLLHEGCWSALAASTDCGGQKERFE